MQVTVQTIADSAIDLADMQRSQFVDQSGTPGSELIRYLNLAYRDLYNQIILSKEYYFTTQSTINVTSAADSYTLPSDFYKLDGVDLQISSGNQGRYLTLRPFQFAERNKFRAGMALPVAPFGFVFRYILVGNQIRFIPFPSQAAIVIMWYTPEPVTIGGFTDILALPPGGDEYMSLYVAELMLTKEESDVSALNAKRMEIIDQLKNSLKDRDYGAPSYIVDESTLNLGAFYPWGTSGS